MDKRGGDAKTMCDTVAPFSKATFPSQHIFAYNGLPWGLPPPSVDLRMGLLGPGPGTHGIWGLTGLDHAIFWGSGIKQLDKIIV